MWPDLGVMSNFRPPRSIVAAAAPTSIHPAATVEFTGNIALKTAEGTAKLYSEFLRRTFRSSLMAQLGYLLAKPAFKKLKMRTDPRRYNGAMLVGLGGVCVKSHGGTDAFGFASAVSVAIDMARNQINDKIKAELERVHASPSEPAQAARG